MATALAVGGWFASAILDVLIEKISTGAIEKFGSQSDLQDHLMKLNMSMHKTRAVLRNAEKRRSSMDGDLVKPMKLLHDAARDAEDLLDELQYEQLRQKVEGGADQASGFLSFFKTWVDDTVSKITEIQKRLDVTTAYLDGIINVVVDLYPDVVPVVRENTSFPTEPVLFGRDKERDQLIELLLKSADDSGSSSRSGFSSGNLSVVAIIGVGGMGKTTLAQFVYNDLRVPEHFDLKIWICVSDQFDVKQLVKEMLESVSEGGSHGGSSNLNALQVALRGKIRGKKFLLVLDDVWNEDRSLWERFRSVLMFGAKGSKILLTTRSKTVARTTGAEDEIDTEGLNDDDCLCLFLTCAFGSQSWGGYPRLEAIGKKIAEKLKGSPLAAKVLGGLLNTHLDENHWRGILESDISELQRGDNDIMRILGLSYHHLPAHLKQCFAYCSLFPKDHLFDKDELVLFWMAQGFIIPQGNVRTEDIGRAYFHDLMCRSFFQRDQKYKSSYVMHHLIHDLAMSVSMDRYMRIEDNNSSSHKISTGVRHVAIYTKNLNPAKLLELCQYNKLRSLIISYRNNLDVGSVLNDMFKSLTSIRVLVLQKCGVKELPKSIRNLKHIRYLDISDNRNLKRLPDSLGSQYNLQVLSVDQLKPLHYCPKSICNLVNLRHLVGDDANVWISMEFGGMGKLTCLQELWRFRIQEDGQNIRMLKDFSDLQLLYIKNTENIRSKEQASGAKLIDKKYLESLHVEWDINQREDSSSGNGDVLEVLEGLQPNRNLRKLMVQGYKGVQYPSWMGSSWLSNLEALHLYRCNNLVQLPACIGQLPFLKVLKIDGLDAVKQSLGFASLTLEQLTFNNMPEWEEWSDGPTNVQCSFPCLQMLVMYGCPKLKSMPPVPSLLNLKLQQVGLSEITCFSEECSLQKLYIHDCEELVSFPLGNWFTSLNELEITGCPKLKSMPLVPSLLNLELHLVGLSEITCLSEECSLQKLKITGCPKLKSMPPVPSSLLYLKLQQVGLSEITCLSSEECSLQKLHIHNCEELVSFPLGNWFKQLSSLEELGITGCPKLIASVVPRPDEQQVEGENMASLRKLTVGHTSILKKMAAASLEELTIKSSEEMTMFNQLEEQEWLLNLKNSLTRLTFDSCEALEALPPMLANLSSLQGLEIYNCPQIQSLPEQALPCSLRQLVITRPHRELKKRCQRDGDDWQKIRHVAHVYIYL